VEFAAVVLFYLVAAVIIFGFIFRAQLRAWWIRRKLTSAGIAASGFEPPLLATRLHELNKVFEPFGSSAAHPSALRVQPQFVEAVNLLAAPAVSLAVVLQYVEGNSWSLASAASAALAKRSDRSDGIERVLVQCQYLAPWTMYFALDLLFEAEPRVAVGAPLIRAKEWWIDSRWMPNIFRDYFARCADRGDAATFGPALRATPDASPHETIRRFLRLVTHPFAATLSEELDTPNVPAAASPAASVLSSVGRFWGDQTGHDVLVEPDGWQNALAIAASTLDQKPPRSLLVAGEPLVGKSSFLRLLAQRLRADRWGVFEASGADLQADQVYIGQLEGRIRQVVDELARTYRMIWYIPDIVQVAMSGRHQGQSATMLDQIVPAIAAGRLVIWGEATPKGVARLMQIKPALRALLETITIESLPADETLTLAQRVLDSLAERTKIRFVADSAQVALDTAAQYLGSSGLPGSALLMLKLSAIRAKDAGKEIGPQNILETCRSFPACRFRSSTPGNGFISNRCATSFPLALSARGSSRSNGRAHRHAQGGPQRSQQADRRLSVCRADRHR
jgi:ATP-dependent Clp protease ATP-binding subunit ClpC